MSNNIFEFVSVWNVRSLKKHRRQAILSKCHGDTSLAGQALFGYSKRSQDPEVRSKARADALYFFALSKQNNGKNGKK